MATKKKKKLKIKKGRLITFLFCLILIVAVLCLGWKYIKGKIDVLPPDPINQEEKKDPESIKKDPIEITISCCGDIMMHDGQLAYAKESDGTYDCSKQFKYVKDIMASADLTLANLEFSLPGKEPYAGYPAFKVPDSILDAVLEMGVDVGLMSNNHMLDSGYDVLMRGVDTVRSKGIVVSGAQHPDENRYQIVDVKGLKVGIISYTYESGRKDGKRAVQSHVLNDKMALSINSFTQDTTELLDKDLEDIRAQIDFARADGANIIAVYMHWGTEYKKYADKNQQYIADKLVAFGADVVFGSHPHVPEEIEIKKLGDKEVPVFMSLGNFISNQRFESLASTYGDTVAKHTEIGMIGNVTFSFDPNTGKLSLKDTSYTPLWVDRTGKVGSYTYDLIPLVEGFENNPALVKSGHVDRAKEALEYLKTLTGEELIKQ